MPVEPAPPHAFSAEGPAIVWSASRRLTGRGRRCLAMVFRTSSQPRKASIGFIYVLALLIPLVGCASGGSSLATPWSGAAATTTFESPLLGAPTGRLLYQSDVDGDFDIYVMAADGTSVRQLTNSPGDDLEGAWSSDGRRIAFTSNRDGNYEIYVMEADGSGQRRLTTDPAVDWGPTWSPDSTEITFASDRSGEMALFVMTVEGGGQRPLGPGGHVAGWAPAWSPTRPETVFVSNRDGDSELWVLDLECGTVRQLTFNDRQDERPAWSPQGDQIVYMGARENTLLFDPDEIYIISRLGGEPRALTDNLVGDITPTWSPDGRWIAFSSSRAGGWNIYVQDVSGSGAILQVTSGAASNREPCWGP
jgi:Tol biopolymer transport system component